jgi:hypothetical protein
MSWGIAVVPDTTVLLAKGYVGWDSAKCYLSFNVAFSGWMGASVWCIVWIFKEVPIASLLSARIFGLNISGFAFVDVHSVLIINR